MTAEPAAAAVLAALDPAAETTNAVLLDAAAATGLRHDEAAVRRWAGRLVLTPHHGEMATLLERDIGAIRGDQPGAAAEAAQRFGGVVVLKGSETVVAGPGGCLLHYPGGGPGLATGGSGDVLSGVISGLLARGFDPLAAAGWGVWLHGEAGRAVAARDGPIGFLARELLPEIPWLLPR